MREKSNKRLYAVILSLSILLIMGVGGYVVIHYNLFNKYLIPNEQESKRPDESEQNKTNEEQKNETEGDKSIEADKDSTINNNPKTNDNSSSKNNNKSDSSSTTTPNKNTNNNDKSDNQNTNDKPHDSNSANPEPPKEDLTKVPNPNDFFYSITGGKSEFTTNSACMKAGEDISFLDVVDIQYYRCYEVMSKANTIMGYYLNIFCENGNCNSRYKAMINISSYN